MVTKIKCLECGDVITSSHRHDMIWCSCGGLFIDGGDDYCRVGGRNLWNYETIEEEVKCIKE